MSETKRRGRPFKPKDLVLSEKVIVYISESERELIKKVVNTNQDRFKGDSHFIRDAINYFIKNNF